MQGGIADVHQRYIGQYDAVFNCRDKEHVDIGESGNERTENNGNQEQQFEIKLDAQIQKNKEKTQRRYQNAN